jgi:hypothetical protein
MASGFWQESGGAVSSPLLVFYCGKLDNIKDYTNNFEEVLK